MNSHPIPFLEVEISFYLQDEKEMEMESHGA